MNQDKFQRTMFERGIEKMELEVRAARATAEREELYKEFVLELMAKEIGREKAMHALNRIRLLEVGTKIEEAKLKGVPKL